MSEDKIKFITVEPITEITDEITVTHNKNSRRFPKTKIDRDNYHETQLEWSLSKYIRTIPDIDFFHLMPAKKLTDELTEEYLISELNSKNIFDFDYFPNEGDYLAVRYKYINKEIKNKYRIPLQYMTFIYKNGSWNTGVYENEITEEFKQGIVQINIAHKID